MLAASPMLRPLLVSTLVCGGLCGCTGLGAASVARDRFDYSMSITDSWKRQTLLNIVKLRYLDPPIFVDVGQIVAGYSLETTLSGVVTASADDQVELGAQGKYTDRPTITYTPLTGSRFVQALMTPFRPESVFFAIQSGWPADTILYAAAASINGLRNDTVTASGVTPGDPEFFRVLELLRRIQLAGGVGMCVVEGDDKRSSSLITFRSAQVSDESLADSAELRRLLGLDPEVSEFELVFGGVAQNQRQIAVMTRSMLHVMNVMSAYVEVPLEHVTEGRACPAWESVPEDLSRASLVRIRSSAERPDDAFVSVRYRDLWFSIDDRDLRSKRAFVFLLMFFALADTGEPESLPLITIPAQ